MAAKLGNTFKDGVLHDGVWQVSFTPADLGLFLPQYECYRIVISNGPPGSGFTIYLNNNLYDSVFPGDSNSWDPNNPMKLSNGDTLTFTWNLGTDGFNPTVWLYFQEESPL